MGAFSPQIKKPVRLAHFLYMQRIKGFDVPDTPHFDAESTAPFKALLDKANLYLEFGAGGSTVVAAGQNKETITVENDRFFARSVEKKSAKTVR